MIISKYNIEEEIILRECREEDLPKLEWFGHFFEHRKIIEHAFREFLKGTNYFLVAEFNNFPIGQIWVDVKKKAKKLRGIIWAFRILEPFHRLGIGKTMLSLAEELIRKNGLKISELNVEKTNDRAINFYKKNGYLIKGKEINEFCYTNPTNQVIEYVSEQWIMEKSLGIPLNKKVSLVKKEKI